MVAAADTIAMPNHLAAVVADKAVREKEKPADKPHKRADKLDRLDRLDKAVAVKLVAVKLVAVKLVVVKADQRKARAVAVARAVAAADRVVAAVRVVAVVDRVVVVDKDEEAENLGSLNRIVSLRNPKPNRSATPCKKVMNRCGRSAI